jgi:malate dehydrogenase
VTPTKDGDWHSVCVASTGEYEIPEGIICSFPIRTIDNGNWETAKWVPVNGYSRGKIDASVAELLEEKSMVSELLA